MSVAIGKERARLCLGLSVLYNDFQAVANPEVPPTVTLRDQRF